ncbi:YbjN domain-containing protein [Reinekea marina]|uniref:YbjN domain-containing protein n=1 Tax=Reinekea marina TaxID=1310421 RepID=A0ABV7WTQ7_9GAMM|nr:YbjN domain-containing protein [Reinekea marina]MDN3650472.1 YbjN domain-containing protein [Reinekea marina]
MAENSKPRPKRNMTEITRTEVQQWIEANKLEVYVCEDCEGIHLPVWEGQEGVLEARVFVEEFRCHFLLEIALRFSAVLPLQGAVHFMNYDSTLVKVMLTMADNDVPRLLISHAVPSKHLTQAQFDQWLTMLLEEVDALYKQLVDMEVLLLDDADQMPDFDAQLH